MEPPKSALVLPVVAAPVVVGGEDEGALLGEDAVGVGPVVEGDRPAVPVAGEGPPVDHQHQGVPLAGLVARRVVEHALHLFPQDPLPGDGLRRGAALLFEPGVEPGEPHGPPDLRAVQGSDVELRRLGGRGVVVARGPPVVGYRYGEDVALVLRVEHLPPPDVPLADVAGRPGVAPVGQDGDEPVPGGADHGGGVSGGRHGVQAAAPVQVDQALLPRADVQRAHQAGDGYGGLVLVVVVHDVQGPGVGGPPGLVHLPGLREDAPRFARLQVEQVVVEGDVAGEVVEAVGLGSDQEGVPAVRGGGEMGHVVGIVGESFGLSSLQPHLVEVDRELGVIADVQRVVGRTGAFRVPFHRVEDDTVGAPPVEIPDSSRAPGHRPRLPCPAPAISTEGTTAVPPPAGRRRSIQASVFPSGEKCGAHGEDAR